MVNFLCSLPFVSVERRANTTMSRHAVIALILCLTVGVVHISAGPLDAALSWARADKLPIEIDVNLPWLPCKYH